MHPCRTHLSSHLRSFPRVPRPFTPGGHRPAPRRTRVLPPDRRAGPRPGQPHPGGAGRDQGATSRGAGSGQEGAGSLRPALQESKSPKGGKSFTRGGNSVNIFPTPRKLPQDGETTVRVAKGFPNDPLGAQGGASSGVSTAVAPSVLWTVAVRGVRRALDLPFSPLTPWVEMRNEQPTGTGSVIWRDTESKEQIFNLSHYYHGSRNLTALLT